MEEGESIAQAPSQMELKHAINSILNSSSLSPDRFGSDFYVTCWGIMKEDLLEAVKEFFRGGALSRFYTSSFIVLILKVKELLSFNKCRPISLCSVVYKILSNHC